MTPSDPRYRLQEEAGHLLVRRAIVRDDWIADAVLDIAAIGKTQWTPSEWNALLAELSQESAKLAEWIDRKNG